MGRNKGKPDDSFNSSTTIQCCCFIQFILLGLETFMVLKNKVIKINPKWKGNSKEGKSKYTRDTNIFPSAESIKAHTKMQAVQIQVTTNQCLSHCFFLSFFQQTDFFSRQILLWKWWLFRSRHPVSRYEKDWHRYFNGQRNSTHPFLLQ